MRVLFVNPPSPDKFIYIRDTNRSGRRSVERTIWPQTSLAMMAGVLENHDVKIIDCMAERMDYKTLYEKMREFMPDWVITNPISSIFVHDMIVVHFAKSLKAKTVIVSPHAKALKGEVRSEYPSLDYIINYQKDGAEPEYILRELMDGTPAIGTSFENLPPARQDLLPMNKYSLPFIGKNFTFVTISRGCPYKCIYCRQAVTYEGQVRYRSVDSVIKEIEKYNIKNFAIHSDTATLNKDWMYRFCSKLPKGVRWICNSRVDTVDEPLLRKMKRYGCWMICYGIESGDDRVLELNKKGATCEQAIQAVSWTKKAGIKVWGYFMLGLLGDTEESMDKTIKFSKRLPLDLANFAISAPYPGTEWNRIAAEHQWLTDGPLDQNYSAIVEQPECPVELVRWKQREAYRRWYFSSRGLRLLSMASRNFTNLKFMFNVISDHIRTIL